MSAPDFCRYCGRTDPHTHNVPVNAVLFPIDEHGVLAVNLDVSALLEAAASVVRAGDVFARGSRVDELAAVLRRMAVDV